MTLNILVPANGNGSRFKIHGYDKPKPLINISGKPMIEWAVNSVRTKAHYIFLARDLGHVPPMGLPDNEVIIVQPTEGAACTALLARERIDNDDLLLIVNCDLFIQWDINAFLTWAYSTGGHGIVTFPASGARWSYVLTEYGQVIDVAEKKEISNEATAGIYFWRRGRDFVAAADAMIAANDRTNGEFYIAPAFNYAKGPIFRYWVEPDKVHQLGTPEDLEKFRDWFSQQIYA